LLYSGRKALSDGHPPGRHGDAAKARDLLSEALAMYESLEMAFHANRTSAKLAAL